MPCTWFVSHALWAGGFLKTSSWTDQGHYTQTADGTAAEWKVPDFLKYIRGHYSTTFTDITADLKSNAVPGAEPGDIIVYDWGTGHGMSHMSFIVDIATGDYPEVSEMGQFNLNFPEAVANRIAPHHSPYIKRGWTYSKMQHTYLQHERGQANMKAYLLHINGGSYLASY